MICGRKRVKVKDSKRKGGLIENGGVRGEKNPTKYQKYRITSRWSYYRLNIQINKAKQNDN